jgi:hypothetical protein
MAKLIFKYTDDLLEDCREASEIELNVPDDMNIHEFKVMCVRLASAIGYQDKTIKNSFGDLVYGDENNNTIKDLIDELNFGRDNKKSK